MQFERHFEGLKQEVVATERAAERAALQSLQQAVLATIMHTRDIDKYCSVTVGVSKAYDCDTHTCMESCLSSGSETLSADPSASCLVPPASNFPQRRTRVHDIVCFTRMTTHNAIDSCCKIVDLLIHVHSN